jgi:hypothetical protein
VILGWHKTEHQFQRSYRSCVFVGITLKDWVSDAKRMAEQLGALYLHCCRQIPEAPGGVLFIPAQWPIPQHLCQPEPLRLPPVEDRLHDVRCRACERQDPADIGVRDALCADRIEHMTSVIDAGAEQEPRAPVPAVRHDLVDRACVIGS